MPKLLAFAQEKKIDLTVVGPDNPLALGIVDLFQKTRPENLGREPEGRAIRVVQSFLPKVHGEIRHPDRRGRDIFDDATAAKKLCRVAWRQMRRESRRPCAGQRRFDLHTTRPKPKKPWTKSWSSKAFGAAGANIVIQEFLEGMEISLHALCDGKTAKLFPTSQDHKRALDGDQGLNTGGMGTYSPTPFLTEAELAETGRKILEPFMRGCAEESIDFRGILYPGIMLTKSGPKVLEFNARFGDPETQVYLTRLENDLVELLDASASGTLGKIELKWKPEAAVCVVMASGGYPGSYAKGKIITGLDAASALPRTKVFHAGTALKDGQIVTNGGRVLGVTALGKDLKAAQAAAYAAVEKIHFDGAHFRRDIAAKALTIVILRSRRCHQHYLTEQNYATGLRHNPLLAFVNQKILLADPEASFFDLFLYQRFQSRQHNNHLFPPFRPVPL